MIEVNHLVKDYGSGRALDDLSLKFETGKIYGLLGVNGAGKSTTMNIITGYIGATSGSVVINGFDMDRQPEKAKAYIGYLPETPPLYPEMTVYEYLLFSAELKKVAKADRKTEVERVIEKTGLSDVKNKLIAHLSKGYKQRVGLGNAIMGSPEVIILDEPTVGLDPVQIIEIRNLIRQLADDHTVIFSSHILSEVSELCDHIFIIAKGKLIKDASKEELIEGSAKKSVVTASIKASKEDFEKLISEDFEEINETRYISDDGDTLVVEIDSDKGVDIREKLFNACAKASLPIFRMDIKEENLEEIFIELNKAAEEEAAVAAAKAKAESEESDEDIDDVIDDEASDDETTELKGESNGSDDETTELKQGSLRQDTDDKENESEIDDTDLDEDSDGSVGDTDDNSDVDSDDDTDVEEDEEDEDEGLEDDEPVDKYAVTGFDRLSSIARAKEKQRKENEENDSNI